MAADTKAYAGDRSRELLADLEAHVAGAREYDEKSGEGSREDVLREACRWVLEHLTAADLGRSVSALMRVAEGAGLKDVDKSGDKFDDEA